MFNNRFNALLRHPGYNGGGKGDSPPPPDYSSLAAASEKAAQISADLGREQLAENKRQYDQNMAVAAPVVQAQTDLMRQQQAQGDDYYSYMKAYSRPVEQQLFYEAMGLTPDEISQVEASRNTEQQAGLTAAKAEAATQQRSPTFVTLPTSSIKTNLPDGAIKGSDLGVQTVRTPYTGNTNGRVDGLYGNSPFDVLNRLQGTNTKVDPNAYYVKNKDGTYSTVNPSYESVNGTQQVAIPSQGITMPSASSIDTPETNALVAKLAAQAGIRQQNEAADTAIADSRKGFTDANNMAIRQGLRYGMSADAIAAAQAAQSTTQAESQAQAAYGARSQAKNLGYAKKLDVAGLYKGLPGASQAAYGLTLNSGNAAVNNQNSTSAQYVNGMNAGTGTIMQGQGFKINGLSSILNSQTSAYNAALSSQGDGGLGALGTIAGVGLSKWNPTWSDRRLKTNIRRVGTHALGIGLYEYDYLWGEHGSGVMADEVLAVKPEAVIRHPSGFLMVNYGAL